MKSPPSSFDSLPVRKRRHRALLDPELLETQTALNEILRKRRLSPFGELIVKNALEEVELALRFKERTEEFERTRQRILKRQTWLMERLEKDDQLAEEREVFQQMHFKLFLLRYGDYLGKSCTEFQAEASKMGEEELLRGRYASDLVQEIKKEKALREIWEGEDEDIRTPTKPKAPYTLLFLSIAIALRITFAHVETTLEAYASRNEIAHTYQLDELIKERSWYSLAKTIHQDLLDLPRMIPLAYKPQEEIIRNCLKRLEDRYFVLVAHKIEEGVVRIEKAYLHPHIRNEDIRMAKEEEEKEEKEEREKEERELKAKKEEERKTPDMTSEMKAEMGRLTTVLRDAQNEERQARKDMKAAADRIDVARERIKETQKEIKILLDKAYVD